MAGPILKPRFILPALILVAAGVSGCTFMTMNYTEQSIEQHSEQHSEQRSEAEVLHAFHGLVAASKALDAERYLAYIDKEKFTGLGADGKAWHSVQELETVIRSGFPAVARIALLEFEKVKVTVINPSTAILVNQYKQTIVLKDNTSVRQSGGGTQVWSKSSGAWKLVNISASDARDARAAVF